MKQDMVWHPKQGWIEYPAAGMQPSVNWNAAVWQRMSEDGSPQASISLNSPWRLFLETDVTPGTEWIPYLPKPGKFQHGKYGEVNISSERNANFVQNFNAGIYQTQLPVDAEHNTKESGALGWLGKMRMNADGSADAQVTWNQRGQQMLAEKRFRYVSPEFYDKWTDPATGKQYNDVAIGAALTTRPFFKESHLRPLIATEQGIFTFDTQETSLGNQQRYGGRRMEESPLEGGQANPQAVAELQQRFAEMEAAHNETMVRSKQLAEALDRSNAVIASMQGAAQTRRFTDLVEGDNRWYGPMDTHLKVLRSFAETFGENSEEFQTYVGQQQALAEQLHTSEIFKEYGHSRQGTKRTAAEELETKAHQLQSEKAGLSYAQAYSEVLTNNPALYDRYEKGE